MLELIAPYPGWLISAAVGAVSGVAGYGIGVTLKNEKIGRYFGIFGIALSLSLIRSFQPEINAERSLIIDHSILPKKLDEVTTWVSASRDGGILTLNYDLSVDMPQGGAEAIKSGMVVDGCINFRPAFKWNRISDVRYVYTAPNGRSEFSLTPKDCVAANVPM